MKIALLASPLLLGLLPFLGQAAQDEQDPAPKPSVSSDWSMFRGDLAQTGLAAGSLGDEFEVLWTVEVGGAVTSSPVVVDGLVYFGSDDQFIRCVKLEDGEEVWAHETEDMIEAPPMVADGVVYCGSNDFYLYALDARTGERKWRYETDDKIMGGAAAVKTESGETRIVFGSYDTHLYCLSTEGELVWRYPTANYVNGTPAIWMNQAVFGGCDAILHVVDLNTGEASRQVELGAECHVAGSVALAGGRAYFGHYGNAFVAVDLNTGAPDWVYTHPSQPFFSSPAITDHVLVFGGRDKHIHCVTRDKGEKVWTYPTRRKVDASPVVCGDKVVVGSGDGILYVLNLNDGELVWSYEIGRSIFSSPAVVDGRILVGANDRRLYCFGPKTTEEKR